MDRVWTACMGWVWTAWAGCGQQAQGVHNTVNTCTAKTGFGDSVSLSPLKAACVASAFSNATAALHLSCSTAVQGAQEELDADKLGTKTAFKALCKASSAFPIPSCLNLSVSGPLTLTRPTSSMCLPTPAASSTPSTHGRTTPGGTGPCVSGGSCWF